MGSHVVDYRLDSRVGWPSDETRRGESLEGHEGSRGFRELPRENESAEFTKMGTSNLITMNFRFIDETRKLLEAVDKEKRKRMLRGGSLGSDDYEAFDPVP